MEHGAAVIMARMTKIEHSNLGRPFIEEVEIKSLVIEDSLFGFIKSVTFLVGNVRNDRPTLVIGAQTGTTSATTLVDSNADFRLLGIRPGDIVTNTTSGEGSVWEVVTVDLITQLTVQLVTSGSGSDDFANTDTYTVRGRDAEDIFIPFQTCIQLSGTELGKPLFAGEVQEALAIRGQGRILKVIAVNKGESIRDSMPQVDVAVRARSAVIQDALSQNSPTGEDQGGEFLFPYVSNYDGFPGIEGSPNLTTVTPDFSKTTRSALAMFLEYGKSENWCPALLREPTNPVIALSTDSGQEEILLLAQGSKAQSFTVPTQTLVAKVGIFLNEQGTISGNMYARLEANDISGDIVGNDIPSGDLLTQWAESNLVSVSGKTFGTVTEFVFPQPIALRPGTTYWITVQYQEENNNHDAGVTFMEWETATAYADGNKATYASGAWLAAAGGGDLRFELFEHVDAAWFYDQSANTWVDQTTEFSADDASALDFFPSGDAKDRYYIGTAGPIRGFDLLLDTIPNVEYGAFNIRYYGTNRAKVTGEHTGADGEATVLTDSNQDFRLSAVLVGDVLLNRVDNSVGVITAIAETQLTVADLSSGTGNEFDAGDSYVVLNLEELSLASTVATSGSDTVLTDTGAVFDEEGVREGDVVVNVTQNLAGFVTGYTTTTVTTGAGLNWSTNDVYKVLSRWRTLTLKDTEQAFRVLNTLRFEWEIPSDADATFFEAGKPEASGVTATLAANRNLNRYWITIQCASVPATPAVVEQLIPLPGSGFSVRVLDTTHEDVILGVKGVHDGLAEASALRDTSEDFIVDHGILLGDIVENLTDGSRGTITAIATDTLGGSIHDTLVATLAGGTEDDWDVGDVYRILRARYRLRYFRNGSVPLGFPANFGLTLRSGAVPGKQTKPMYGGAFSRSTRSLVNRIRVIGRHEATATGTHDGGDNTDFLTDGSEDFLTAGVQVGDVLTNDTDGSTTIVTAVTATTMTGALSGGAESDWDDGDTFTVTLRGVVESIRNDRRSQREQGRVVMKTITDFSIKTVVEAQERGDAELARLSNQARRGTVMFYEWPFFTKIRERQNWFNPTVGELLHRLNGEPTSASAAYRVTADSAAAPNPTSLIDSDQNFKKWGVEVGDLATNITNGATMVITAISTTTNENDTLEGTLSGSNVWNEEGGDSDPYKIEQRDYVQVGALIQVKVDEQSYIDFDYLVTGIEYEEPSFVCELRLSRNLIAPSQGDQQTVGEIMQSINDTTQRSSQRGSYN